MKTANGTTGYYSQSLSMVCVMTVMVMGNEDN